MKLNKRDLSMWSIIAGLLFIPIFIVWVILGGGVIIKTIFSIILALAWIVGVVLGILIILDFVNSKSSDLVYLIGGILMIVFPFLGAILLLINKAINK